MEELNLRQELQRIVINEDDQSDDIIVDRILCAVLLDFKKVLRANQYAMLIERLDPHIEEEGIKWCQ